MPKTRRLDILKKKTEIALNSIMDVYEYMR